MTDDRSPLRTTPLARTLPRVEHPARRGTARLHTVGMVIGGVLLVGVVPAIFGQATTLRVSAGVLQVFPAVSYDFTAVETPDSEVDDTLELTDEELTDGDVDLESLGAPEGANGDTGGGHGQSGPTDRGATGGTAREGGDQPASDDPVAGTPEDGDGGPVQSTPAPDDGGNQAPVTPPAVEPDPPAPAGGGDQPATEPPVVPDTPDGGGTPTGPGFAPGGPAYHHGGGNPADQ